MLQHKTVGIFEKRITTNITLVLSMIFITTAVALTGCTDQADEGGKTSGILTIDVVGDVHEPAGINGIDGFEAVTIEHKGSDVEAVPLQDVIDKVRPYTDNLEILYIANDGFSALISNENIEESYLCRTHQNGWEAVNKNHPVSSNIKNIKDIVIICSDLPPEYRFNIIEPGSNILSISPGELHKNGYSIVPVLRGKSTSENSGMELEASTFNRIKAIDIDNYVNLSGRDKILVVGEKGELETYRQDGRFVVNKNSIGYMAGNEMVIQKTVGIVMDPPDKAVTDVYHDVKKVLAQGDKIMVILIDGLGYHRYEYARDKGCIPFLESLPQPEKSMSAYPPVTPVNVAASLTGELPHVNGVYNRDVRRTEVPTIFGFCKENGKSSSAVIGPMSVIELEIDPVLSMDDNSDGSTDDEKTINTLAEMGRNHDLLFVHYKDLDKIGHSFGDINNETLETISRIDGYIEQLLSGWDGHVLIYADHGMHNTDEGGTHGSLITEDMFTPYWLFDK